MGQSSQGQQHAPVALAAGKGGRSNRRTALVLLSIALVFFIGVIVNRLFFA